MNCQRLEENLWLYLYDEMGPDERALADRPLSACAACRDRVAAEEGLHALLGQRAAPEAPLELLVEARVALESALDREEGSWRNWARSLTYGMPAFYAWRAASVAAVLAVGFGLGWVLAPHPAEAPLESAVSLPADSAPALIGAGGLQNYRIHSIRELVPDPQTGTVRVTLDAQGQVTLSGSLDDPQIQRVLLDAARSYKNPGIRRDTLGLLRLYAAESEVRSTMLYALLNDSNAGVRMEALDTVRTLDWSPDIRDAMLGVLRNDPNAGVRVGAVNTLVRNAGRQLLPVLREFAESDRSTYVRMQCASAVRRLEAEEF